MVVLLEKKKHVLATQIKWGDPLKEKLGHMKMRNHSIHYAKQTNDIDDTFDIMLNKLNAIFSNLLEHYCTLVAKCLG